MSTRRLLALAAVLVLAVPGAAAAQMLETETARPPGNGVVVGGAGVEIQTSSEGTETAVPTFVEGGIGDRLELVVEQVVLTAIRPKNGMSATGLGDLEVTLLGLAVHERPNLPAIAFAAEVKAPTARDSLIGTRETDYTGYVVLSKAFGNLDLHGHVGYALLGDPPGVDANNVLAVALAARYRRGALEGFGEFLFETAAIPETSEGGEQSGELTGGETVGTLGAAYRVTRSMLFSLGLSIDNNAAVMFHPGITIRGHVL